jgi:uncharacterized protein (TIGR02271 family)
MEKVKDKLHLGHKDKDTEYTSTHHTTAAAAHHSSTSHTAGHMPLASGAAGTHAGALDSRDLNRDGHISTGERLASGGSAFGAHSSGFDARDTNRDGHLSTSEKLHSHTGFQETEATRLKLHEEQLAIAKKEVGAGELGIHKRVQEEHVQQTIPVMREEVTVERRPLTGHADANARIASQDEVIRVPLHREEVVTEKRIVPTEEVIVRKKEVIDQQTVGATLKSEYVETMQTGTTHNSSTAFDARDTNRDGHVSMGEKFKSSGHAGGAFDARDTNHDGHVSTGEKLHGNALGANSLKSARG